VAGVPDRLEIDEHVLQRAARRRRQAGELESALDLIARWSNVGEVVPVGAVAFDLVVSHDIDYEVFTPEAPAVRAGFGVLADLAELPTVTATRFRNAANTPDQGLYWQVRCRHDDGDEWKIDIWTLARDHPGPCAAWIVEPMRRVLTDELRAAILRLKELRAAGQIPGIASIDIYRAAIDDGVRTADDLRAWIGQAHTSTLTHWRPGGSTGHATGPR
jgi:hypothetical protein